MGREFGTSCAFVAVEGAVCLPELLRGDNPFEPFRGKNADFPGGGAVANQFFNGRAFKLPVLLCATGFASVFPGTGQAGVARTMFSWFEQLSRPGIATGPANTSGSVGQPACRMGT